MKRYEFTITMAGYGDTPEEAWQDAFESFSQDSGGAPDECVETTEEGEEDI